MKENEDHSKDSIASTRIIDAAFGLRRIFLFVQRQARISIDFEMQLLLIPKHTIFRQERDEDT